MSWDADLIDDRGHRDGEWNYTHNCNRMANTVLLEADYDTAVLIASEIGWWWRRGRSDVVAKYESGERLSWTWWTFLDNKSGPDGAAFLNVIIRGLEGDPERFRAMNPENGWGDYDSFLKTLRDMRAAVPEWPTRWSTSG